MAARTGDRLTRLIAHRAMGASLAAMGEFEAARAQLEPFLALENADRTGLFRCITLQIDTRQVLAFWH
jgi:hypothetical protein